MVVISRGTKCTQFWNTCLRQEDTICSVWLLSTYTVVSDFQEAVNHSNSRKVKMENKMEKMEDGEFPLFLELLIAFKDFKAWNLEPRAPGPPRDLKLDNLEVDERNFWKQRVKWNPPLSELPIKNYVVSNNYFFLRASCQKKG